MVRSKEKNNGKTEKRKFSKRKIARRVKQKTDLKLKNLVNRLKKSDSEFWLQVARLLARPRSKEIKINLKQINKLVKNNDTVLVPGKVLGDGLIDKTITLSCYRISNKALDKLNLIKSKLVSIEEIYEKNKKGEGIKLID